MDPWTIVFVVAGLLLIASELVFPSLVGAFLGLAALITAGLRGLGIVESLPVSLLVFAVTSLALVIPGRLLIQRLVPGRSERRKDEVDVEHDRDAMGEHVVVVEDVSEDHDAGRIRFQGTTWQARSIHGDVKAGDRAQLVYREGPIWIVEPVVVDGGARVLFERLESAEAEAQTQAATSAKADRDR